MWKHLIIDDFLSKEHFDYILKTFDTKPIKNQKERPITHTFSVYENEIKQKSRFIGFVKTEKFSNDIILDIHKTYTPRLLKILEELAPEKLKFYDHADIIFTATPKDYKYGMHVDIPSKLLSVVIYLKPEKNTGTILYESKNGKNPQITEWKPNRALIFSRTEETWHSYEGDGVNDRYVLVYNLVSKS